ncbi:DsrE family protein [bacterium]|nr:DsrE family protein [bacterium]
MTILFIINEHPFGNERTWNALRLARRMSQRDNIEIRLFFFSDSVFCASEKPEFKSGAYDAERNLTYSPAELISTTRNAEVLVCGTCCKTRGVAESDLHDFASIGSLDSLSDWITDSNRVITY